MTVRTLLEDLPAYTELQRHAETLKSASIEQFFKEDDQRAHSFTVDAAGLQLDYSKNLLNPAALTSLVHLADQAGLQERITSLFHGEKVNNTEDRPALHTLLRASRAEGHTEKFAEVLAAKKRMQNIAIRLNKGEHTGYTGAAITDVVNIGIGGSDLGPRLVTQTLKPFHGSVRCHYVANVDPADLQNTLQGLDPARTLFIVCSKTIRTE
jgi:glucose-6-phosphate isomerase